MLFKHQNFARSFLALPTDAISTSLMLNTGDGAKFPILSGGQVFYITIKDAAETKKEICRVTSISGDLLTVVRGVDGTTAQTWAQNDLVEQNVVAAILPNQEVNTDSSPIFNTVKLDTTPDISALVDGELFYDEQNKTISAKLGNVSLQFGQEMYINARNSTGALIPDGSVVYITGATGNKPNIAYAIADQEPIANAVIGVTTEDIDNNANGFVTTFGLVRTLNTSAYDEGDLLYLSPTVQGGLTKVKPSYPNLVVEVGRVVRAHTSLGEILIKVSHISSEYLRGQVINGDVSAASVTNGSITPAKLSTGGPSWDVDGILSATTPAQFDSDTSVATTAFVQRALGNFRSGQAITSAATLTAADVGKSIVFGGSSSYAVNLPLLSDVADGAALVLTSNTNLASVTIQRQGSDVINMASQTATSFVLNNGDSAVLVKSTGTWRLISGSAQLPYSPLFGSSLAANGYQKLPSGLIIQWGEFGHNGGSTAATINFPISFASWRSSPVAIRAKGDGNFDTSSVLTVDRNVVGALPLANFTAFYQGSARSFAYICIGQ